MFGLYCQQGVLFFTMLNVCVMLTQQLTVVMLSVISCCVSVCDLCDSACKQAAEGGWVIGDARPRQSRRETKETKSQTGSEDTQPVKLENNISSTVPRYSAPCVLNVFSVSRCSKPVDFLSFLRPGAGRPTPNDKLESPVLTA